MSTTRSKALDPTAGEFVPSFSPASAPVAPVDPAAAAAAMLAAMPLLPTTVGTPEPGCTVVLKRLPPELTHPQLQWTLLMLPVHPVAVRPHSLADGNFSGVAFIEYATPQHASTAMSLLVSQSQLLFNKKIKVEPKRENDLPPKSGGHSHTGGRRRRSVHGGSDNSKPPPSPADASAAASAAGFVSAGTSSERRRRSRGNSLSESWQSSNPAPKGKGRRSSSEQYDSGIARRMSIGRRTKSIDAGKADGPVMSLGGVPFAIPEGATLIDSSCAVASGATYAKGPDGTKGFARVRSRGLA